MSDRLPWFCAAIVGSSLLGGALPLATVLTHTRLQIYLSFAAGAMLGAAFFHMLPEAAMAGSAGSLRWGAGGLLALFFLERFFAFHHHEAPEIPGEPCPPHPHEHRHRDGHSAGVIAPEAPGSGGLGTKGTALHWGVAAFGLALHTFVGGLGLASATQVGPESSAWGVFVATLVHKPADSMTIVSLMLRAGVPRAMAHLVNLGFAMVLPLGAMLFRLGSQWSTTDAGPFGAAVLAFSAGTFLYIALSDILPELQFHAHDRVPLSLALVAGVGLMAVAGWWG